MRELVVQECQPSAHRPPDDIFTSISLDCLGDRLTLETRFHPSTDSTHHRSCRNVHVKLLRIRTPLWRMSDH